MTSYSLFGARWLGVEEAELGSVVRDCDRSGPRCRSAPPQAVRSHRGRGGAFSRGGLATVPEADLTAGDLAFRRVAPWSSPRGSVSVVLRSTAAVPQFPRDQVPGFGTGDDVGHVEACVGGAGRDCPAETDRRPPLRDGERADIRPGDAPIRVGASLPVAVVSTLHQAFLWRLPSTSGMDVPPGRGRGGLNWPCRPAPVLLPSAPLAAVVRLPSPFARGVDGQRAEVHFRIGPAYRVVNGPT